MKKSTMMYLAIATAFVAVGWFWRGYVGIGFGVAAVVMAAAGWVNQRKGDR